MQKYYFRGKTVDTYEFVAGDLIYIPVANRAYIHRQDEVSPVVNGTAKDLRLHEVSPSTVRQFSGLSDCEGRMIYDGDTIQYGSLTAMLVTSYDNIIRADEDSSVITLERLLSLISTHKYPLRLISVIPQEVEK